MNPRLVLLMLLVSVALAFATLPASAQAPTRPPSTGEPLTLERAIEEALQNNLALLVERHNVATAEADLVTARLRPNPLLSLDADHLDPWTGLSDELGVGPAEYAARVDFVIERGGKRAHRTEAARTALSIAQLQLLNHTRTLVYDVQSAWVDVLLAQANLALARDNLEAFEGLVRLNTVRVNAGDVARVELFRVRLAALSVSNAVRRQDTELRNATERLRLLIGRSRTAGPIVVSGTLPATGSVPNISDVQRLALDRRPDLLAARSEQARSLADLRLQLAHRQIDYTVGTEYRRLHRTGNALGVFFSVPLPLFDRHQGDIARARAEQERAAAAIRALEAEIESEIETAHADLTVAHEVLQEIERDMLQQAQQVRDVMSISYRRGEASLLELLDAQMTFNETMDTYNEARGAYARSRFLLDTVSGLSVAP